MFLLTRRLALCLALWALVLTFTQASSAAEPQTRKEASVVSRLDPALRKALLQALSNLSPIEDDADADQTTLQYDEVATTEPATDGDTTTAEFLITGDGATTNSSQAPQKPTAVPRLKDQVSSVQYHSYVVDQNAANEATFDNEIIRTIIVKASDKQLSDNKITDDDEDSASDDNSVDGSKQLDPVSSLLSRPTDNVQIARSVSSSKANEITADDAVTAKKPSSPTTSTTSKPKFKTTTTTTTTTTTPAPTHNEDGENIETVLAEEVSISQAPLVTAFTIQQDSLGRPNSVIPLAISNGQRLQQQQQTIGNFIASQQLSAASLPAPSTTMQPPTTQPAPLFRSNNNAAQFDVSNAQQLEQQVAYLQQQQRHQDALFREQQQQFDRQALQRQQQLLLEQRLRIENDYRLKQQQYEQEIRAYRQQQQQNEARKAIQLKHLQFVEQHRQQQQQQFVQALPAVQQQQPFAVDARAQNHAAAVFIQQLPNVQQQQLFQPQLPQQQQQQQNVFAPNTNANIQIIPSVAFASSLATQQLLPAKQPIDFQQQQNTGLQFHSVSFSQHPAQQLNQQPLQQQLNQQQLQQQQFQQQQNFHQLAVVQELPQRQFQQFRQSVSPVDIIPAVDTILPVVETQGRNRVFRQEIGTGNLGFNTAQSDRYLQSFLQNAGVTGGAGRQSEDFNIITKVLALNHGIPNAQELFGQQQRQF